MITFTLYQGTQFEVKTTKKLAWQLEQGDTITLPDGTVLKVLEVVATANETISVIWETPDGQIMDDWSGEMHPNAERYVHA